MSKHDKAKLEKRARNEIYAKKFAKEKETRTKKKFGTWAHWCRTKGHPSDCNCVYE